jgi:hypothetical protein
MFISLPQYEFPFPPGLADPDAKHWRVMEMRLHSPWFLLTVELPDPEGQEMSMAYTLCIAWEQDLADALKTMDTARVLGLVAMIPAWCSPTGQWSSRQVSEVWLRTDASGKSVTLKDIAGEEFDGGIPGATVQAGAASELLLRLQPRKARQLRPRQPASGRSRRPARTE